MTIEPINPAYDVKNIKWWWENYHINPDGQQTEWIPCSKPIWFTEYGFASVDGTTNEPNRFYDPDSMDGGLPVYSQGRMDVFAQRKGLQATLEVWKDSPMVERKFAWCWDARPYPAFPSRTDLWGDSGLWYYGHWLNGKLGMLSFDGLLRMLLGEDYMLVDNNVNEEIEGLVINSVVSVSEVLAILQKALFFDYYERDGRLHFAVRNKSTTAEVNEGELVALDYNENGACASHQDYYKSTTICELPHECHVSFVNRDRDYQVDNAHAGRILPTNKVIYETTPLVMSAYRAELLAERMLWSMWAEQTAIEFRLPPTYLGRIWEKDLIWLNLKNNNEKLLLRIISTTINPDFSITLKTLSTSLNAYMDSGNNADVIVPYPDILLPIGKTILIPFQLPHIPLSVFFATNGSNKEWRGCVIYQAKVGSDNYKAIAESHINSVVGICLNVLGGGRPYYQDLNSELYVAFNSFIDTDNTLNTITNAFDFLDYGNLALVGRELIQFQYVELCYNGAFKLMGLLRGQHGTEEYINMHEDGEKFILINESYLVKKEYEEGDRGKEYKWRGVSIGGRWDDDVSEGEGIVG